MWARGKGNIKGRMFTSCWAPGGGGGLQLALQELPERQPPAERLEVALQEESLFAQRLLVRSDN